jgi:hypothetical protein
MSHSDFFKKLYIAAVSGGLIKPSSEETEVQHVMQVLLQRYLEVAQTTGEMNTGLSGRTSSRRQRGAANVAGQAPRTVPVS